MHDKIQEAFGQIQATDQMKRKASDYLEQKNSKKVKGSVSVRMNLLLSACALLMLCFGVGGWYFLAMPVSYVSVDINPSVELTLNRMNVVIKAEDKNEEGARLLEHLPLKGKNYLEAVELLVESEAMQPYLTKDAELTFTVASPKSEEILSGLENSEVTTHYHGMCRSTDMETVTSAHECGMSLGKYQMYQLLSQYGAGLTAEDCQNISMCQLRRLLSQYEEGRDESVSDDELKELGADHSHSKGDHNGHHDSHHNVN